MLVSPPTKFLPLGITKNKKKSFTSTTPPLGLAYIAAVLEKNGYRGCVKIKDMFIYNIKDVKNTIKNEKPDIIGISCFTDYRHTALQVAEIAKKLNQNIIIVMGGAHASFMYNQILSYIFVDIVCIGESENTFLELIKAIEKKKSLENIKGIAYKNKEKIIKTPDRPLIQNLDEIPFPARHLFEEDYDVDTQMGYYDEKKEHWCEGKRVTELKSVGMITSRGCPFNCLFCSTSPFWGHKWRFRSAKNVIDEIEMLYNQGVRFFDFYDDNFTADRKRVLEICDDIIERKLDIRWKCSSRVSSVDEEIYRAIKKAGCIYINFGIESGSPKILKIMRKGVTIEQQIKAFQLAKKVGIDAGMMLIVGNVGETKETIQETLDMMLKAKPSVVGVNILKIFPNTDLYKIAEEKGQLNNGYWLNTEFQAPLYTAEYPIETLLYWRRKIMLNFYLRVFGIKRGIKYIINNRKNTPKILYYIYKRMTSKYM